MNEIMQQCCTGDGRADFDKIRRFMEQCGKTHFSHADIGRMQEYCDQAGMADIAKMQDLMVSCGCQFPETRAQE